MFDVNSRPTTLNELIIRLTEIAESHGPDLKVLYDGIWYNRDTKTIEFVNMIQRQSEKYNIQLLTDRLNQVTKELDAAEGDYEDITDHDDWQEKKCWR